MLLFTLPFLFRSGTPWEIQGTADPRSTPSGVPAPVGTTFRLIRTGQLFQKFGEGNKDWKLITGGDVTPYGSGADGPLHITAGNTFVMDRDYNWTTVLIDAGGTLQTGPTPVGTASRNGFAAFASDSFENNGQVVTPSAAGAAGAAGVGGVGGGNAGALVDGTLGKQTQGGSGGNAGVNGSGGTQGFRFYPQIFPATAGKGGNSAAHVGGATAPQDPVAPKLGSIDNVLAIFGSQSSFYLHPTPVTLWWSGSGGGGAGGVASGGGGGGGGGNIQMIASPRIFGGGIFIARGGDGGKGQTLAGGDGGGGGGGHGGLIIFISSDGAAPVTTDISGGVGGAAGGGTAQAGFSGDAGVVKQYAVDG